MKIQNKIKAIKEIYLKNKDGFTIGFNDLKPYSENKGFSVGITNIKGKNLNNLIKKVLFIGENGFSQIDEKYIGGWFNPEDKMFYLDLSIISENTQEVKFMLKRFNQISCFSFKDFNTYKESDLK